MEPGVPAGRRRGGAQATFEDIAAGIDLLADLPVSTSRVAAIGHSAGGHLAAWAAGRGQAGARRSRRGAAGRADSGRRAGRCPGPGGLRPRGNGRHGRARPDGRRPGELPERVPARRPDGRAAAGAPVLCAHSRADGNVPFRYSERYVQAATGAGGTRTCTRRAVTISPSSILARRTGRRSPARCRACSTKANAKAKAKAKRRRRFRAVSGSPTGQGRRAGTACRAGTPRRSIRRSRTARR